MLLFCVSPGRRKSIRPCRWAAGSVKLKLKLELGAQMSEGRSLATVDEYAVHGALHLFSGYAASCLSYSPVIQ